MTVERQKIILATPLDGAPRTDNFNIVSETLPDLKDGEFLVKHQYIALDPYHRLAIGGRHQSVDGPLAKDAAPESGTVGHIIASRNAAFAEGETVFHQGGWQSHSISDGTEARILKTTDVPLTAYLGCLGMPGLTAYASVVKLANVQPGQTVLVSAASGPVGATLGQIAIQLGAKAVGIAGSDEKCSYVVDTLGFESCVNYKHDNYLDTLKDTLPGGADIYHDNVGGQMLLDAFQVLKEYGTVVLCGLISQYNDPSKAINVPPGVIMMRRATVKGLIVYDFNDNYDEFLDLAVPWVRDGKMKLKEDIVEGLENLPGHFVKLMAGENFGKTIVAL